MIRIVRSLLLSRVSDLDWRQLAVSSGDQTPFQVPSISLLNNLIKLIWKLYLKVKEQNMHYYKELPTKAPIWLMLVAMLLNGCSLAPKHERPEMPVPNVWASCDDPASETIDQRLRWEQFFRNPILQSQIEAALCNNRDLRIAISQVDVARSQYLVQRAELFPQLSADTLPMRFEIPKSVSLTGNKVLTNLYAGFLGASWEIDLFGRVRNLSEAAFKTWLATDEARRAIALSLIAEVANTWLLG